MADLPGAWREGVKRLLGLEVPSDAVGCLQTSLGWRELRLLPELRRRLPDRRAAVGGDGARNRVPRGGPPPRRGGSDPGAGSRAGFIDTAGGWTRFRWSKRRPVRASRTTRSCATCGRSPAPPEPRLSPAAPEAVLRGPGGADRRLRRGDPGDRHAVGRAGDVVDPRVVQELDRVGSPPCSPQTPSFDSGRVLRTSQARPSDQLPDTGRVEGLKRRAVEDLDVDVACQHAPLDVVAAETEGGLRQIVGAEGEEVGVVSRSGPPAGMPGGSSIMVPIVKPE